MGDRCPSPPPSLPTRAHHVCSGKSWLVDLEFLVMQLSRHPFYHFYRDVSPFPSLPIFFCDSGPLIFYFLCSRERGCHSCPPSTTDFWSLISDPPCDTVAQPASQGQPALQPMEGALLQGPGGYFPQIPPSSGTQLILTSFYHSY